MSFSQRTGMFISETHTDAMEWCFTVEKMLVEGKTKFQEYQICEIPRFGKTLFLDYCIQTSALDEHIFHECMSCPAMTTHPNPKSVFVAGGGEGATLREALAHNTVEKAVMVDIDDELVAMVREHMPEWPRGSFDDPRTTLLHMDARKYLEETDEKFDVILSDLPDPLEGGPAVYLFTKEYFELCMDRLSDDGVFAMQAGCANMNYPDCFAACLSTVKEVFPIVRPYWAIITTFLVPWAFILCSKKHDPLDLTEEEIARRFSSRGVKNRYYTPRFHQSTFTIPDYLYQAVEEKGQIMTDARPFIWTA
ncbi:MAG: polyamine aminopropyltransferase [Fimbriimonadales bacterium]|nr:polyamine aminopropyltransferase [Fimbriimonadales bacterium]